MSSRNKELPVDLIDRLVIDCGLELKRGVGGCSSRSLPLILSDGGFSDMADVTLLPRCGSRGGVLLEGSAAFSALK